MTTSVFDPDCLGFVSVYVSPTQVDAYEIPVPWVVSGSTIVPSGNSPLESRIRIRPLPSALPR